MAAVYGASPYAAQKYPYTVAAQGPSNWSSLAMMLQDISDFMCRRVHGSLPCPNRTLVILFYFQILSRRDTSEVAIALADDVGFLIGFVLSCPESCDVSRDYL